MSDPVLLGDLLPAAATALERALADVEGGSSSLSAETIATLWDPATCPAALLPFLAWAYSVDVWDASWPEDVQRAAIAASPEVHSRKGTIAAVRAALAALGMTVDIEEWWQTTPPGRRGTFTATAYAGVRLYDDGNLATIAGQALTIGGTPVEIGRPLILNPRTARAAQAQVRATKPKSRVVNFQIGISARGELGVAGGVGAVMLARPPLAAVLPMPAATVGVAGAVQAVMLWRPHFEAAA